MAQPAPNTGVQTLRQPHDSKARGQHGQRRVGWGAVRRRMQWTYQDAKRCPLECLGDIFQEPAHTRIGIDEGVGERWLAEVTARHRRLHVLGEAKRITGQSVLQRAPCVSTRRSGSRVYDHGHDRVTLLRSSSSEHAIFSSGEGLDFRGRSKSRNDDRLAEMVEHIVDYLLRGDCWLLRERAFGEITDRGRPAIEARASGGLASASISTASAWVGACDGRRRCL